MNVIERVKPQTVGVSPKGIINFLDSIIEKQINLHSFMLLRHGKVVAEGYYRPFNKEYVHNIFSVSKSVTSAAIGIAIGEGLITLEDRVIDFFEEKIKKGVHPYTAEMKIKHLLAMATVHNGSTNKDVNDWVKTFLNTMPSHLPGTVFAYDTTGTHTLCAILQKQTGMTVNEYLRSRLFDPIGIGPIEWESCHMNINKGGSGIKCTTEDLARFGQLYLQKGLWEGKQVLPKAWVELSTTRHIDTSNTKVMLEGKNGYAYHFWRARHNAYCAFGMGGQFVVVVPEKDVVFVSTANTLLYRDGHQMILDSFWENIYPSILASVILEEDNIYIEMQQRLEQLELILPIGKNSVALEGAISNRRIKLDENCLEYGTCQFIFKGSDSRLIFFKGDERKDIKFGMGSWVIGIEPFFGLKSAASATWVDEKTCIIHIQAFDVMQMLIITCHFEEDYIVIQIQPVGEINGGKYECYLNAKL